MLLKFDGQDVPRIAGNICVGAVGYVFLGVLSVSEHRHSLRPSSILLLHLLCATICDGVRLQHTFRTLKVVSAGVILSLSVGMQWVAIAAELMCKGQLTGEESQAPEDTASIFNRAFLWWLCPLFVRGFRARLSVQDTTHLDKDLLASSQKRKPIATEGKPAVQRSDTRPVPKEKSLFLILMRTYPQYFLSPVLPRLCWLALTLVQPPLVKAATTFVSSNGPTHQKIIGIGIISAYVIVYIGIAVGRPPTFR